MRSAFPGLERVAVAAYSVDPAVYYSRSHSMATAPAWTDLTGPLLQLVITSAADASSAGRVNDHVNLAEICSSLRQRFIGQLELGRVFPSVHAISERKDPGDQQLRRAGYDAVIRLYIEKLALHRVAAESMELTLGVRGEMTMLRSGEVLWDRSELVKAEDWHPLSYFESNGLVGLDALLEKAAVRLAYDFLYIR